MGRLDAARWSQRIRQERLTRNWRQRDLADQLGTSVLTIQRWEGGNQQPSAYFRIKLCALFGKSAQELGFILDDAPTVHPNEREVSTQTAREQALPQKTSSPDYHSVSSDRLVQIYDPAIPASFFKEDALVGRASEFHLLKQQVLTHAGSFALYGLPGVGKTALTIALSQDREITARFHDGILWAGLGREPDQFRLLSRWGSLLGLTSQEMTMAKTKRLEVLAQMLRDAIGTRRMLLILDDAWEITTALQFQIGGRQCAHLVTTRFPPLALHFAGENAVPLQELNEEDSMTLLRQFAPTVVIDEFHEAQELIHSVGGLPLALTLMGKYLQVQAHDRQPRRVRKALEQLHHIDTRLRLATPQALIDHHPSLPVSTPLSLQATIEISEQQLDTQARERFRALSIFPAKPHSFSEAAALAICELSEADLDQFTDAGLLESHSPNRYMLHQTIADYAQQYRADTKVEEQMVLFFVALVRDHHDHHDLLEQEHMNILTAFKMALRHGMMAALQQGVNHFVPFLIARGLYTLAVKYLNQAQQAAVSTGDDEELARSWFYLGRIAQLRGDLLAAEHAYLEGLMGARKKTNKELMTQLLAYTGEVIFLRGDLPRANYYFQEGLKMAQELRSQSITALILRNLGEIADDYYGDPVQGNTYYLQGLELARQGHDWRTMSELLQNLGVKAEWNGAYVQAKEYYQEGMACAQRIHDEQRISALLMNMGMLAFRQKYYAQAEAHYQEALKLARKTENYMRESGILQNLGILAGTRKQWKLAETYLQESLEMASRVGHDWLYHETLYEIGELHLKRKQIPEAQEAFQEVLSKAEQLESHYLKASALYGLARVEAARSNFVEAYRQGHASRVMFAKMEHMIEKQIGDWLDHMSMNELSSDQE